MDSVRRLSKQANEGLHHYLKSGNAEFTPHEEEDEDDHEDTEFEDYFQTLVTRGSPRGVLTVHIKSCTDFKNVSAVKRGTQSFLRVSVGEKVKCTHLQPYDNPDASDKIEITFNEWKYFSIRIVKQQKELVAGMANNINVELIFFEPDSGVPKLMGKTFIKLLDVLNRDRMTVHLEMKLARQVVCKLELDLVITYGTFGYGYSHQLRHTRRSMESFIDRSLFLRCPPPMDRKDARYNVLTPRPIPYLDIIGTLLKKETAGPASQDNNTIFHPKLMEQLQRRGRLLQLHETFESYDNPADVLEDLEKIIYKRGLQMSSSWRQQRKAKKTLKRWKTKATLIPKLLGMCGKDAPPAPTMRSGLLAAAGRTKQMRAVSEDLDEEVEEDTEESFTPAATAAAPRYGQSTKSAPPRASKPRGVTEPTSPSPVPLFRPGESLLPEEDEASMPTARRTEGPQQWQQQQQPVDETVVRGMKSLSLGSEKHPSSSGGWDARPATSPGQAGFSGSAPTAGRLGAGALEKRPPPPGRLNLPHSQSPAQPWVGPAPGPVAPRADSAPPPSVLGSAGPSRSPPSAPMEDPAVQPPLLRLRMSSIPSLSSVISEADLEPIKSSLALTSSPSSSQSQAPQAAGSTSTLPGGGHRSKPGRDKLRRESQDGTAPPYRRPSHPR